MKKWQGYLLAALSAFSYGLIPLFIIPMKQIQFSMNTTLFYRFAFAALLLLPIIFYKKISLKVTGKELIILMLLGLFYGISSDLLFLGYDYLTPGIASSIYFIFPVLVVIMMVTFFKEKLSKYTVLSLFVTLIGVFILSVKGESLQIQTVGLLICVGGALFYALYIVTVNKSGLDMPGWKITFYSMFFVAVYYFVKVIFWQDSLKVPDFNTLLFFAVFALVTTVVSASALVAAIKVIGSTPTSIMAALEPIVAVLVSVILFGESLTINLIAGATLIIVGVIISFAEDLKGYKFRFRTFRSKKHIK